MNFITHTSNPSLDELSLYPNPASSTLFIESPVRIGRIEICDLRAAVLSALDTNDKKLEIDISGYPSGIYIVHIYREGLRTVSLKLLKSE
jgi:hypothetical protein